MRSTIFANGVFIDKDVLGLDDGEQPLSGRFTPTGRSEENFFLCSPKVTDSLILTPVSIPNGLKVLRQAPGGAVQLDHAFRAGALSACFLVITYASRELLDVDPDEFEILDPKVKRQQDGSYHPVLQIADSLVNGSGLCNRLVQPTLAGQPLLLEIMAKVATDLASAPLLDLLEHDHASKCMTACYRCLHRYGNQGYHGLLDWRLGLSVLQMLLDGAYVGGLDGNFDAPGLADWPSLAGQLAGEAAGLFYSEHRQVGGIPVFGIGGGKWAAVVHPFWSWDALLDCNLELRRFSEGVGGLEPVTTFDLSRRMGEVLLKLRRS